MKTYLKVKICSLAAEAVIIKREENKWKQVHLKPVMPEDPPILDPHPLYFSLHRHRIHEVRTECRSAHIAYGYLRGRAYKQIEHKCYEQPNWQRVAELVYKYGQNIDRKLAVDLVKNWSKEEIKQAA